MKKSMVLIALLTLGSAPAWAVNKCTGPDGKVVFQDAPCSGRGETIIVRPASGSAPARAEAMPGAMTEAQRIEAAVAESQKDRRRRELVEREVPAAASAIQVNINQCQEEQDRLERSKGQYVQNLYGKTDAAQKAAEQAASAARCNTKDRELRERHALLLAECRKLGGCP